jgi:hypothetical protein
MRCELAQGMGGFGVTTSPLTGGLDARLGAQINEPPAAYLAIRSRGLLTTCKESPDA